MADKEKDKKKIFISYSHRDRDVCAQIDDLLEKQEDFDVWYDKELVPGEIYRKKIAGVIRDSSYFILLLSKSAIGSDWIYDEVEYAKKLHKKILPIWIEDVVVPDDLDMILQRYHSLFWHLRSSDAQFENNLMAMFDRGSSAPQGQAQVGYGNEFSESVNLRMKDLLEMERTGRFAECYEPRNAVTLGCAYLFGGPCAVDRDKARHYFNTAKYYGNTDAECYLLRMDMEDKVEETWDEPDEEFTRPLIARMEELAAEGCVPARLYMGNLYWHGKYGVEKDYIRSAEMYEQCAREGNARAQFVMSSNYYYGDGVEKNYDLAIMYANLALEQKYIYSWRRWGKFYRDGLAVPQDYAKARECYEQGAKMGDFNCYNKVGDMLYHGWGFPIDYEESLKYFREGEKAPAFGQSYSLQRAKTAIGRAYETGRGVETDVAAAAEKYLEGYQCGSLECRDAYLRCSQSSEVPKAGKQSAQ